MPANDSEPSGQKTELAASDQKWRTQQTTNRRFRFMFAAAALVFLCSALISQPGTPPNTTRVMSQHPADPPVSVESPENFEATRLVFSDSLNQLGGLWDYMPSDFGSLTSSRYLDISSLGKIDLVSLVPENQIRAVRGLPATFESIQPIYRASIELPVLQQWSNGINCTLGLIQTSLPSTKQKQLDSPTLNDLGSRALFLDHSDRRSIC